MGIADVATEGFHEAWRAMTERFPGGSWDRQDGLVTIVTGMPVAPFNGVWSTSAEVDQTELLSRVDALASSDLPFNVQLRAQADAALSEVLRSRDFVQTTDIPLMFTTPAELVARPAAMEMTDVATYDDLGEHLRLLELAFGMPADLTRRGFPFALFAMPGVRSSLGSVDGEVVTTGLSVRVGDSVGIFNIATPEQHRGKGYGGAVTAELARTAFARGATSAWLQASPLGEPVYRGLGFATVESWQQWIPTRFVH